MNKAIFIDKDGTLIKNIPYNIDPELITLENGALTSLKKLKDLGYLLIVVTNQAGVARGYFDEKELEKIKIKLFELLSDEKSFLDGFYYCPHHPAGKIEKYSVICACRKPEPGLILEAAKEHNVDLTQSWMIGDILNDVEAGNNAGCRSILIDNGNETEWLMNEKRKPAFMAKNLKEAADYIGRN